MACGVTGVAAAAAAGSLAVVEAVETREYAARAVCVSRTAIQGCSVPFWECCLLWRGLRESCNLTRECFSVLLHGPVLVCGTLA